MIRWHHRWNVLALTLLVQTFIIGLQSSCFTFWIVPWLEDFHAPISLLMLAITFAAFVAGFLSPFAGLALDRFPIRILLCVGITIFCIALLLISGAGTAWMVVALYALLTPIGTVFGGPLGCQTLIARWFTEKRGFAMGLCALGSSLGGFVLPPIATALLAEYGWRISFRIFSLATFLLLVPATWWVLRHAPPSGPGESDPASGHAGVVRPTRWSTAALLHNGDFRTIAFAFFAMLIVIVGVQFSLGRYAQDIGISQKTTALGVSLLSVCMVIGNIVCSRLLDRIAHYRLYWGTAAILAAGTVLISLGSPLVLLAVGVMLAGFATGSFLPLSAAMVADRFGAHAFGQVMGLSWIFINLALFGPFVAGMFRDAGGGYPLAFLLMLLPMVPAAVGVYRMSTRATAPQAA